MNISLAGRRALVTGGSSGIGRAIAIEFARAGARVAVHGLGDPAKGQAVVDEIAAARGDAIALQCDVADVEAVDAMFTRLDEAWGGIDILVHSAGIDGPRMLGHEAQAEDWHRVIEVNLFGAFHCARGALRRMRAQRQGTILMITSVHEVIPWSGYSAYAASKAGLAMMARTLAQEAAPDHVRVFSLAPGAIRTPINQSVWSDPQANADLLQKIPLGRIGEPEEVARFATMLCSDAAGYLTGTTVFLDGGMTDYPAFAQGG